MERREIQVKDIALESMIMMQKMVYLQDLQTTLETRQFPELARSMGNKGAYEYFSQQHAATDSREAIVERNKAMWEAMMQM